MKVETSNQPNQNEEQDLREIYLSDITYHATKSMTCYLLVEPCVNEITAIISENEGIF